MPAHLSDTSDEEEISSPDGLKETKDADLKLLPEKSRDKYLKAYDNFDKWRLEMGEKKISETVLLSYFMKLSQTKQSPTMWSIYSMLKATLKAKNDIHMETYSELGTFLKGMSVGHEPKKSKMFTASDIEKFITEAPDIVYLAAKVILIIGINGACRTNELLSLTVNSIEKHSEKLLLINLPTSKTTARSFVVREEYVQIVEKYRSLRPENIKTDRFFLQYHNGKCIRQPMGINKLGGTPKDIATFLNLQDPQLYTGHCFRRTSATLLADAGADLTLIKRHGDSRRSSAVEDCVEVFRPGTSRENVETQPRIWVCIDPLKD